MSDSSVLPFANTDLQKIAKEVIEGVIGISQFQANQVAEWSHAISSQILEKLTQSCNQCKYIVNCVVVQNNGAGIHSSTTCFWDNQVDRSQIIRWENKSVHCLVNIFGLSL